MIDIIRDSTIGQVINSLSLGRLLPYADQKSDYVLPEKYRHLTSTPISPTPTIASTPKLEKTFSLENLPGLATPPLTPPESVHIDDNASIRIKVRDPVVVANTTAVAGAGECRLRAGVGEKEISLEEGNAFCEIVRQELVMAKLHPAVGPTTDPYLVDWDGPNDPDNPRHVHLKKYGGSYAILTGHRLTETGRFSRDLLWLSQFPSSLSPVSTHPAKNVATPDGPPPHFD